jgi:PAS domain S-box-containing protein
MPDAVVVTASNGSIVFINRAAEVLFGYERNELIGQPVEILIPSQYRGGHRQKRQAYSEAPHVRPMGLGLELRALTKDGHEIPVEISLAPLQMGPETQTIAAVRDVSQRKKLEEKARAAEKAAREVHQREEIFAVASHELRGPVGVVMLQTGALKRAVTETMNDLHTMQDRMHKIERNARHLTRLVDDLLDLRQLRDPAMHLNLEELDLAELAREAADRARDTVEGTGATLTFTARSPVRGRWDPIRLDQVITNLLVNAAKFGNGKPITVAVEGDSEKARITVSDEGIGIDAADQERIFDIYAQARTPLEGNQGIGLGLHIVHEIVKAHGGRILLRSAVGRGSTFTIELPRMAARGTG